MRRALVSGLLAGVVGVLVFSSLVAPGQAPSGPGSPFFAGSPPSIGEVSVSIPHPPEYTVRFIASGLGASFNWSATLGTQTEHSTAATTIAFVGIQNGTYNYYLSAVGSVAAPSFGSLTVLGADVNLSVSFSPTPGSNSGTTTGPPLAEVLAVIVVVLLAVFGTVWLLVRRARRRRDRPSGPSPPTPSG